MNLTLIVLVLTNIRLFATDSPVPHLANVVLYGTIRGAVEHLAAARLWDVRGWVLVDIFRHVHLIDTRDLLHGVTQTRHGYGEQIFILRDSHRTPNEYVYRKRLIMCMTALFFVHLFYPWVHIWSHSL